MVLEKIFSFSRATNVHLMEAEKIFSPIYARCQLFDLRRQMEALNKNWFENCDKTAFVNLRDSSFKISVASCFDSASKSVKYFLSKSLHRLP